MHDFQNAILNNSVNDVMSLLKIALDMHKLRIELSTFSFDILRPTTAIRFTLSFYITSQYSLHPPVSI